MSRVLPTPILFLVQRPSSEGGAAKAIASLARRLSLLGHAPEIVEIAGRQARLEAGVPAPARAACTVSFFPLPGTDLYYPHGGCWKAWERQNLVSARPAAYRWYQHLRVRLSGKQRSASEREAALLSGSVGRPPTVIAISRWVAEAFVRHHSVAPSRLAVVYNGVDVGLFRPDAGMRDSMRRRRGWDRSFVCLFAAHNFRLKGLANFLSAAARLKDPSVRWVVAGKGNPRPYQAGARKLGCASSVEFAGSVPDLAGLYQAADLLVQPTFYDPCSLTSLEALASGLPVVTSAFNGVGEILRAEGGGLRVEDPQDIEGLVGAIERIRGARRGEFRGEARATAERHTEEAWARAFLDAVRTAAGAGGGR